MNKKNTRNGSVALAATVAMVVAGMPVSALADTGASSSIDASCASKTQVVYAKSSATGTQEGVYVVNQFESKDGSSVRASDAGAYSSVKNLVDDQELSASGTSYFEVSGEKPFLYQGDLPKTTQLPWTMSISYTLDGKSVSAADLADARGNLVMTLDMEPNDACMGDYADNYLVQLSGSFNNDAVSNLEASGATLAQSSGSTQVSYMIFPGKSAHCVVSAHVDGFTFDGWTAVGVPLSIALDVDDSEFGDSTGDLDNLEQAIRDVDEGAASISDASSELSAGAGNIDARARALSGGLDRLSTGTGSLSSSLNAFAFAGNDLVAGSKTFADGLNGQASSLMAQADAVDVDSAQAAYQQALTEYMGVFSTAFAQAYAQTGSREQAQESALQATAQQRSALESALAALVRAQATKSANASAASALMGAVDGYAQIGSGISDYADTASALAGAASALSGAAASANEGAGSLVLGTGSLVSGAGALSNGANALSSGTSELSGKASGLSQQMIDQVRDSLEDYLNPTFELDDFVNGSSQVDNVQFVVKTDAIQIPDEVNEDAVEPEKTFIEKFLALFGL